MKNNTETITTWIVFDVFRVWNEFKGWGQTHTFLNDICSTQCLNQQCGLSSHFSTQIGWRSFRSEFAMSQTTCRKMCNVFYPSFVFIMLCITCVSQVVSCLSRTRVCFRELASSQTTYAHACTVCVDVVVCWVDTCIFRNWISLDNNNVNCVSWRCCLYSRNLYIMWQYAHNTLCWLCTCTLWRILLLLLFLI